jgi:predicted small lipoprotein YifL
MSRAIALAALGAASLLAAGCGQKGPLYLPDKNTRAVTTQPSEAKPAPTESAPAPVSPPAAQPKPTDGDDKDSGGP